GDLADALAAGRDARLLEPSGPGEDRFRHELVRDAIYDALPEAVREERHAQAGRVLAELAGRGRDVDDAEAAYHLVRAGPGAAGAAGEVAPPGGRPGHGRPGLRGRGTLVRARRGAPRGRPGG